MQQHTAGTCTVSHSTPAVTQGRDAARPLLLGMRSNHGCHFCPHQHASSAGLSQVTVSFRRALSTLHAAGLLPAHRLSSAQQRAGCIYMDLKKPMQWYHPPVDARNGPAKIIIKNEQTNLLKKLLIKARV